MRKSELLVNVSAITGLSKEQCEMVIDAMVSEITNSLINGEKVAIHRFMTLEPGERGTRKARNPSTGEVQTFPPVKTVKCKLSREIKNAINKG